MSPEAFDVKARTTVFQTPWFSVKAKYLAGPEEGAPYYALEAADYVTVVAVTVDRQIVLVRQYRPAIEGYSLELPSGTVDAGESPVAAAARELLEETGYRAIDLELLAELRPDTGRLENRLWCYFTKVANEREEPLNDGSELGLETVTMPIDEFLAACGSEDGCVHALNLAPIALALLRRYLP